MRLFVAVNLPDETRRSAHRALARLRDSSLPVSWTRADTLHVTLKFLGEVAASRAEEIGSALSEAVRSVRPFDVGLSGLGAFPDAERPRVFWLGVERHPALELLAHDVERALTPLGFDSELKPFQPHLTLGRAKKTARLAALRKWAELAEAVDFADVFRVESVDLMRSVTGPRGSTYTIVQRAVLDGGRA